MMLQIDHRESRDVDIFLPDPQLLSFLDPQKNDFQFEIQPDAYRGDGARSLRFAFDGLGEIDFIVAGTLTSQSTKPTEIEGELVLLETIPEIVTKKIYYRGFNLEPRDIFDIAAAGEQFEDSLIEELRKHRDRVAQTLAAMDKLDAGFVDRAVAQLPIKERYRSIAKKALARSKALLGAV